LAQTYFGAVPAVLPVRMEKEVGDGLGRIIDADWHALD
jgi:hypothetical protein